MAKSIKKVYELRVINQIGNVSVWYYGSRKRAEKWGKQSCFKSYIITEFVLN